MFEEGRISTQDEVYELMKWQGTYGSIVGFAILLLIMYTAFIDKIRPSVMLPTAFIVRALNFFGVKFINSPES